jgi:hypothetical protein
VEGVKSRIHPDMVARRLIGSVCLLAGTLNAASANVIGVRVAAEYLKLHTNTNPQLGTP